MKGMTLFVLKIIFYLKDFGPHISPKSHQPNLHRPKTGYMGPFLFQDALVTNLLGGKNSYDFSIFLLFNLRPAA